ncbi:MAG: hypothetical protein GKS05_06090 [Nitrospirales bacterium]|nr:hypothetical protein [Nitrospirales bacterium]
MGGFNFDQFFDDLKTGITDLAKNDVPEFLREATDDGKEFLGSMRNDLLDWTQQLADGQLSKDEFEFLVKGRKDLAKMEALTQAGATVVKVNQLKSSVVSLIIDSARQIGS